MLILESESWTHRCKFLGSRSQVTKDRCGGGETEQAPILTILTLQCFSKYFARDFLDELQTGRGSFGGSKSCAKDFFFFLKEMNIVSADI